MIFEKCVSCSNGVVLYGFVVLEKYTEKINRQVEAHFAKKVF